MWFGSGVRGLGREVWTSGFGVWVFRLWGLKYSSLGDFHVGSWDSLSGIGTVPLSSELGTHNTVKTLI